MRDKKLLFPCECVSGMSSGYSDPWADIAKRRLLPNGTKEQILNLVADEPMTLSQLAEALKLSPPSVHAHINDLLKSELLRESEEYEKRHPSEHYYEPSFPIFRAEECEEFQTLCDELASQFATYFEQRTTSMETAFKKTKLAAEGWQLNDVTQCLYTNAYRKARTLLEQRGLLQQSKKHANGAEWIFWAEKVE